MDQPLIGIRYAVHGKIGIMEIHVHVSYLESSSRDLHPKLDQYPFIRLNTDYQLIASLARTLSREQVMRCWLEMDHSLRNPGGKTLACPDVKGNPSPPPVVYMEFQRCKCLGH